jgi:hypothetical protein
MPWLLNVRGIATVTYGQDAGWAKTYYTKLTKAFHKVYLSFIKLVNMQIS